MTAINTGRMTHEYSGELVVFMIGMTINKWWRFDRWVPVFRAMPQMIAELMKNKESGLLGYRLIFDLRGPWLVQYWDSLDKLYAYASDRDAKHRPAWTAYNRRARTAKDVVGVWHETFVVDRAESIYVNSPLQGLAKATSLRSVTGRLDTARARVAQR